MAQLAESVHTQIRFQHEVLRALLGNLANAAERTLRGEPAEQELRDTQRTLHYVLEQHLSQEEAAVAPLLRARWSPGRLVRMHADHCKALDALQLLRTREPKESAHASQRLVLRMLAAMAAEECDMLGLSAPPSSSPAAQVPRDLLIGSKSFRTPASRATVGC